MYNFILYSLVTLYSLTCIPFIVFINYHSGWGGGDFLYIVDYIDIVNIGQCAAACVIAMLCPHHGIVYTVPAHTVC